MKHLIPIGFSICLAAFPLLLRASETAFSIENPFLNVAEIKHQYPVFKHGGFFKDGYFYHPVQENDNLFEIAKKYIRFTDFMSLQSLIQNMKDINGVSSYSALRKDLLIVPIVREDFLAVDSVPRNWDFFSVGIYLSAIWAGSDDGMEKIERFREIGGNTVIFDLKDVSGQVYCRVDSKIARVIGSEKTYYIRDLPKLIDTLHNYGMHAVARVTVFADKLLCTWRPDLALKNTAGELIVSHDRTFFADPSHPDVQNYNLEIIESICRHGVDEIQLDYVRFPSKHYGVVTYAPDTTPRDTIITGFVKRVHELTRAYNILLSLDVYGITIWEPEIDIQTVGQRLPDLARHCDAINPMIYPSHFASNFAGYANPGDRPYAIISLAMKRILRLVDCQQTMTAVRPWLQAFPYNVNNYGPGYIRASVEAAVRFRRDGYHFWSPGNRYNTVIRAYPGKLPGAVTNSTQDTSATALQP
jgi:hypothetical protein